MTLDGRLASIDDECGTVTEGGQMTQPNEDLVQAASAAFGRGDL